VRLGLNPDSSQSLSTQDHPLERNYSSTSESCNLKSKLPDRFETKNMSHLSTHHSINNKVGLRREGVNDDIHLGRCNTSLERTRLTENGHTFNVSTNHRDRRYRSRGHHLMSRVTPHSTDMTSPQLVFGYSIDQQDHLCASDTQKVFVTDIILLPMLRIKGIG